MSRYRVYKWAAGENQMPALIPFNPQPRTKRHVEPVLVEMSLMCDRYRRGAKAIELIWEAISEEQWTTLIAALDLIDNESKRGTFYLPDRGYRWHFYNGIMEIANYNREFF